jgi:hypothetical protein
MTCIQRLGAGGFFLFKYFFLLHPCPPHERRLDMATDIRQGRQWLAVFIGPHGRDEEGHGLDAFFSRCR